MSGNPGNRFDTDSTCKYGCGYTGTARQVGGHVRKCTLRPEPPNESDGAAEATNGHTGVSVLEERVKALQDYGVDVSQIRNIKRPTDGKTEIDLPPPRPAGPPVILPKHMISEHHSLTAWQVVRRNPAPLLFIVGLPAAVFAAGIAGAFGESGLLIAGVSMFAIPLSIPVGWLVSALTSVSMVIVVTERDGQAVFDRQWWPRAHVKAIPSEIKRPLGNTLVPVIDMIDPQKPRAFWTFTARESPLSSRQVGKLFVQDDSIILGQRMGSRTRSEVIRFAFFGLIIAGELLFLFTIISGAP